MFNNGIDARSVVEDQPETLRPQMETSASIQRRAANDVPQFPLPTQLHRGLERFKRLHLKTPFADKQKGRPNHPPFPRQQGFHGVENIGSVVQRNPPPWAQAHLSFNTWP